MAVRTLTTLLGLYIGAGALVVAAKEPSLPEINEERGAIGVSLRAIAPAKFVKSSAIQVYFVRVEDDEDPFAAEYVISSNYSRKGQVFLLNAKPGRYFAVGAKLGGGSVPGMVFEYRVYFSKEMIPQTETVVVPGAMAFMGEYVVSTSTRMRTADPVQAHYYQLISPESSGKGYTARAFSGRAEYKGKLKTVVRDSSSELRFRVKARDKAFKKDPAWREFVWRQMEVPNNGDEPTSVTR